MSGRCVGPSIMTMADPLTERAAIVALLRSGERSWPQLASDVLDAGSALAVYRQRPRQDDLFTADGDDPLLSAAEEIRQWEAAGIGVYGVLDEGYPSLLRDIRERPPLLFTRGILARDSHAIAVVGTRKPSDRGRRIARMVARHLVDRNVTVVSGLAAGIDGEAHRAALAAGGRTVAVIGTGITRVYPAHHHELQEEIATRGLVISQFWPDAPPRREQFPMRNAVMSGYTAATVVIEAGQHSGARIQARLALEHGRQVILLAGLLTLDWARALTHRPGVMVAETPDELFSAIDAVLEERTRQLSPSGDFADIVFA